MNKYLSVKIDKESIVIFFVFLLALNLDSISPLTGIKKSFLSAILLFICVYYLFLIIANKRRFSLPCVLTIIFFGWFLFSTFINRRTGLRSAYNSISSPLAIAILTEYYMYKKHLKMFSVLKILFFVLCISDIASILIFPDGLYSSELYQDNWLLGYKSARIRAVGLPAIVIAAYLSLIKKNKLDKSFFIISIINIFDSYLTKATGGMVSEILLFLLIIFEFGLNNKKNNLFTKLTNPVILTILIIVMNIIFAILQDYQIFEYLITNVLNKNMTISGRNKIWSVSMIEFLKSPIIGHGYISSSDYINITGVYGGTQPHNIFLGILVYTGLIGLFIFGFLVVFSLQNCEKDKSTLSTIAILGIIAYMIFGITSFTTFSQFLYSFFIIFFYLRKWETQGANNEFSYNRCSIQ